MPAPYSYDLRSKAVAAVKRGEKKIEVSRFFKISCDTLKKTYGYRERDEEKRREFIQKLELIESRKKVYVDEAGAR